MEFELSSMVEILLIRKGDAFVVWFWKCGSRLNLVLCVGSTFVDEQCLHSETRLDAYSTHCSLLSSECLNLASRLAK